ncbi:hypothetical protein HOH45_08475 [bacterium]|nr:hypothetical protein [bacterium]
MTQRKIISIVELHEFPKKNPLLSVELRNFPEKDPIVKTTITRLNLLKYNLLSIGSDLPIDAFQTEIMAWVEVNLIKARDHNTSSSPEKEPLLSDIESNLKALQPKAIVFQNLSPIEKEVIKTALKDISQTMLQMLSENNVKLGFAFTEKDQLKPITQTEEIALNETKHKKNVFFNNLDIAAFLGTLIYSLSFNMGRVIPAIKNNRLGEEYADSNILKQATFTEFDHFILGIVLNLCLVIKYSYFSNWKTDIAVSTTQKSYIEHDRDTPSTLALAGNPQTRTPGELAMSRYGIIVIDGPNSVDLDVIRTAQTDPSGSVETSHGHMDWTQFVILFANYEESLTLINTTKDDNRFISLESSPIKQRQLDEPPSFTGISDTLKKHQTTIETFAKENYSGRFFTNAISLSDIKIEIEKVISNDPYFLLIGLDEEINRLSHLVSAAIDNEKPLKFAGTGPAFGIGKSHLLQNSAQTILQRIQTPSPHQQEDLYLEMYGNEVRLKAYAPQKFDCGNIAWNTLLGLHAANYILHLTIVVCVTAAIDKDHDAQDTADNVHFSFVMNLAWLLLLGIAVSAKNQLDASYNLSPHPLTSPKNKIPELYSVTATTTPSDLVGVQRRNDGTPHNQYDYKNGGLFNHDVFFSENLDTLAGQVRRLLEQAVESKTVTLPCNVDVPLTKRAIFATSNDPEVVTHSTWNSVVFKPTDSRSDYKKPWNSTINEQLFASIIMSLPSESLVHWPPKIIEEFLKKITNPSEGTCVICRQILDVVKLAGKIAIGNARLEVEQQDVDAASSTVLPELFRRSNFI